MKHPVWDRILILLCALIALGCAAGVVALLIGKISFDMITGWIASVDMSRFVVKAAMAGIAALFVLLFLLLFAMILPSRKKRSSNYAIQRNENGMVRISLKALETLVNKCLNQHAELKVVTSSLYSDEESIRVDVHISLQSDISMPLAISALQKQIKKYLEACSGVMVQEVRVFVDSTIPADEKTEASPYAIPTALLGLEAEPLPVAERENREETATEEETFEEAAQSEEESKPVQPEEKEEPAETGDNEQGEQA
ncbi:MAG: alkaline shock response membrane anchor protein AmaP [Christensenellales bacterium]